MFWFYFFMYWMYSFRQNGRWILVLLLLLPLGVAVTTDPLTDLGRLFFIFNYAFLSGVINSSTSLNLNREYCWEVGFLPDGWERHLCEGHR